jgi:hypothetical protein
MKEANIEKAILRLVSEIDEIQKKRILPREEKIAGLLKQKYPGVPSTVILDRSSDLSYDQADVKSVLEQLKEYYE